MLTAHQAGNALQGKSGEPEAAWAAWLGVGMIPWAHEVLRISETVGRLLTGCIHARAGSKSFHAPHQHQFSQVICDFIELGRLRHFYYYI